MSDAENNLTYDKFKQLLAAVGSQRAPDAEQVNCSVYDFRKSHYFNTSQFGKLKDFAATAAKFIASRFFSYYGENYDVTVSGIDQQYAADYSRLTDADTANSFSLTLGADQQNPAGFVNVPQQAASQWLKQVLGDSESQQNEPSELSQLEQSFLFDIVSIFVHALVEAYKSLGFKPFGGCTKGQPNLNIQPTETLCVISFDIKKADAETCFRINIIIIAGRLNAVAQKIEQAAAKPAPDLLANAVASRIQEVFIPLTIQFDSTMLTFQEVMTLRTNDVIILDKKITDQAGIFLSERKLFSGRLARVGENKAIVISEPAA
jgi:flagellar motor switch protein FliM